MPSSSLSRCPQWWSAIECGAAHHSRPADPRLWGLRGIRREAAQRRGAARRIDRPGGRVAMGRFHMHADGTGHIHEHDLEHHDHRHDAEGPRRRGSFGVRRDAVKPGSPSWRTCCRRTTGSRTTTDGVWRKPVCVRSTSCRLRVRGRRRFCARPWRRLGALGAHRGAGRGYRDEPRRGPPGRSRCRRHLRRQYECRFRRGVPSRCCHGPVGHGAPAVARARSA